MAVDASSLEIGKCYVTASNQVRKIVEIEGDKVRYDSRGSRAGEWSGSLQWVNRNKFATDVDRQVNCSWDKDYPEQAV